jgi:hypothetical protein
VVLAFRSTSEVFACPTLRRSFSRTALPLLAFRSLLESFDPRGRRLPWPFGPFPATASLAVLSPSTSSRQRPATYPRVCLARVGLPSQRFSRSQGLSPPAVCRPCFMPVPPLGFCPSRPPPARRASDLSAFLPSCGSPLEAASGSVPTLPAGPEILPAFRASTSRCQRSASRSPAPGLCSLRPSVSLGRLLRQTQGPRPSWASPSSGVSLSTPQAFSGAFPRSSFPVKTSFEAFPPAPQSFWGRRSSAWPSQTRPPLSRFPTS